MEPMIKIMSGSINSEATLWIKGEESYYNPKYYWPTKDFEDGEFHIFKLHFRSQTERMIELMNEVDKHNETLRLFTSRLKELIEEKTGLPVREGKGRPFIYTSVPTYLQQTLRQLVENKSPKYDFRQARIDTKADCFDVCSVGLSYAEVTTEDQANSCKNSLIELMESTPLLKEMRQIDGEAKRLERKSKNLASLLDFTRQQYDKYGKILSREKDCPICQVIFE
jgi:hypothetical protein